MTMDEVLPEEFDQIIIGTGLAESVLSGALSRIGQKVLHLDANDYYGGNWASFSIKSFDDLMNSKDDSSPENCFDVEKLLDQDEKFLPITRRSCVTDKESVCNLSQTVNEPVSKTNGDDKHEALKNSQNKDEKVKEDCENELTSTLDPKTAESLGAETEQSPNNTEAAANDEQDINETNTNPQELMSEQTNSEEKVENEPLLPPTSPYEDFYKLWRHFNIDLGVKVLFSRGSLVELLIQSNVSRYLEFRNISRILTLMDNKLQPVPCTRADVFKSKFVSVVQKRILMRILTMCANYEKHPEIEKDYADKRFVEFLVANKLCNEAQHFIIHSIAMVNDDVSTMEGVRATKKFLDSLGRYGNSAFLFPTYGVGEIPQAFSRLSAVFGGLFCLRRYAVGLIVDQQSGQCKGIIDSTGQKIRCNHVIVDEINAPDIAHKEFESYVARAVYVTDRSLLPSTYEHASLITLPATGEHRSIRLLELGPAASVCPPNHYLLHAVTNSTTTSPISSPNEVYDVIERLLFTQSSDVSKDSKPSSDNSGDAKCSESDVKPHVLWRARFNIRAHGVDHGAVAGNLHIMNGPSDELGFETAITEARRVFEIICPEEEFLPRAPEPEEIIFNDEGYNTEKNGSSSSESPEETNGDYEETEEVAQQEESATEDAQSTTQDESDKANTDQNSTILPT